MSYVRQSFELNKGMEFLRKFKQVYSNHILFTSMILFLYYSWSDIAQAVTLLEQRHEVYLEVQASLI